jgi:hypothetical protein
MSTYGSRHLTTRRDRKSRRYRETKLALLRAVEKSHGKIAGKLAQSLRFRLTGER